MPDVVSFDNAQKGQIRDQLISAVQTSPLLFGQEKLRASWLELAGPECLMYPKLEPYLTPEHRMIAVDRPRPLAKAQAKYPEAEFVEWVATDDVITDLDNFSPRFADVGVFNADFLYNVDNAELPEKLQAIFGFATRQLWEIGAFALALNLGLRGVTQVQCQARLRKLLKPYLALPEDTQVYYRGRHTWRVHLFIHLGPRYGELK